MSSNAMIEQNFSSLHEYFKIWLSSVSVIIEWDYGLSAVTLEKDKSTIDRLETTVVSINASKLQTLKYEDR